MITGRARHWAGGSEAEKILALFHQAERPSPAASPEQRAPVLTWGSRPFFRQWGMQYQVKDSGVTLLGLTQGVQRGDEVPMLRGQYVSS